MQFKDNALTLLKVTKKEGVGKKSGKDYKFYSANVVDQDANVFQLNLADELVDTPEKAAALESLKNVQVTAVIDFKPKGFDIGGTIRELTVNE